CQACTNFQFGPIKWGRSTAIAIPDQPLVLIALIIGMILEFPHLAVLKQFLLSQARRKQQIARLFARQFRRRF
ncbi:hypothetical protein, partial [Labrenzia sp. CE80]|uniref:hypothetical protein n=1 Tax=Labrenzia sp. CE80 TaxID=1788986 RepID=UPI001AD93058